MFQHFFSKYFSLMQSPPPSLIPVPHMCDFLILSYNKQVNESSYFLLLLFSLWALVWLIYIDLSASSLISFSNLLLQTPVNFSSQFSNFHLTLLQFSFLSSGPQCVRRLYPSLPSIFENICNILLNPLGQKAQATFSFGSNSKAFVNT